MTAIEINGSDNTTLHLMHLDLPPEAVDRFTTMAGTGEWPLKYGLGASVLRPSFVDTVDLRDLGEMPLSQYLSDAYDLPARALGAAQARVDQLRGHVIILPPQAFGDTSQTLHVAMPLTHIGSFSAPAGKGRGAKLRSTAAMGEGSGGPGVPPRGLSRGLMLTLIGLGVFSALLLALFF